MTRPSEARLLAALLASAALLTTFGVIKAEGKDRVAPVYAKSGVAINGYDAVAYFNESRPVKGSDKFQHVFMGAKFNFASAANRDKFAANPDKYAPQFGGYCAWAVSQGYTAPTDPNAWKVVDGKLYLNYSRDVQKKWEADQDSLIRKGQANWPNLRQ